MAASKPWSRRTASFGLRQLYIWHRWLGIAACLFFAMWFGSGLVMMYVPYPALEQEERLAQLPAIDWAKVKITPEAALAAAGASIFPEELRLEMRAAEPVYRLQGDGRVAVSALDGRRLGPIDPAEATAIARAFGGGEPRLLCTLQRDQWTVAGGYDWARPMYLFDLNDGRGGRLYVSQPQGEVALETSGRERFWNWVGSVPHWIYPTVLRQDNAAWRQVVMWISGVAVISAVTGMWIGILRVRLRRRAGQAISPYRGWMKWHHWAGLIGGVFLTTWIVSGWWSVNPFRWFDRPSLSAAGLARYAGQTAARMPANLPLLAQAAAGAKQIKFYWVQGRPLASVHRPADVEVLDATTAARWSAGDLALFAAAGNLVPDAGVASTLVQTEDDDYWYSHHDRATLPVLRVAFDDPGRSWVYIDPVTGQPLAISNSSSRAYRWVFEGLHRMDFRFLWRHRPAWDVVLWLLSLAGIVTSISGVVIGWRRLVRKVGA